MSHPVHAHMETIYGWVCRQPDQEVAIAALEDYALRGLHAWLAAEDVRTGVPVMILGLLLCEAARRFLEEGGNTL